MIVDSENQEEKESLTTRFFDGEEYLSFPNAHKYVGMSGTGFRNLVKRWKGTDQELKQWEFPGSPSVYFKKVDLDRAFRPREIE